MYLGKNQKILNFILLSMLFLLILSGCGLEKEEDNTLWVVTELSNSDGMNYQADVIANRMMEKYPGLEIKLDILPTDAGEREIKLKHLRTQIMSGKGPDVYLLPTGTELRFNGTDKDRMEETPVTPLLSDVNQAMRLGVFLDITEYYVPDDALKQEVMEAGILDGKCLVLPLRFQVPVVYTRPDLCEEYEIPREVLESDFLTLARFILSLEDVETAAIGLKFPEGIEVIAVPLDYQKGEVLVSQEQIVEYLTLYQQQKAVATETTQEMFDKWDLIRRKKLWATTYASRTLPFTEENYDEAFRYIQPWPEKGEFYYEYFNLLAAYTCDATHWSTSDIPIYVGYLSDVLENLGVTKITGQETRLYPLRSVNGEITAQITYWGAVGSSCSNPALAYEFLSQFLEEEFQWDLYRPHTYRGANLWDAETEPQFLRMVEESLPVRIQGCVEPLWDNLQYQVFWQYDTAIPDAISRAKAIRRSEVYTEDVPELNWEIDYAYFPADIEESLSLAGALEKLNNPDATPTDVNIEELAEEVYQNLWWHLAEG